MKIFMQAGDTIAAISSPPAPSARIIVRLSGPRAAEILSRLEFDLLPEAEQSDCNGVRRTRLRMFCGAGVSPVHSDEARGRDARATPDIQLPVQIYQFRAPNSYTGEEIIELHIPGNPLLVRMLLEALLANGARAAEAGEFTARAYFAGKIDLTQAEGIAAAIHAQGEAELNASRQLLAGELTRRLKPLSDLTAETLALVEAGIDFVEEGISFIPADELRQRISRIDRGLESLVSQSARFERISHEPTVVLAGRPNAGKSTLLNALAGRTRAVVSATAGTTRDAIWAEVALSRGVVRVIDVAGISELENPHREPAIRSIEKQMHAQASKAIATADVVVLVIDVSDARPRLRLDRSPDMIVRTKNDLIMTFDHFAPSPSTLGEVCGEGNSPQVAGRPSPPPSPGVPGQGETDRTRIPTRSVSALRGDGLAELKRGLDQLCFGEIAAGAALALNARHLQAISEARSALGRGRACLDEGMELLASELREALDALGRISGQITPDDLLGRIFSSFCIGK